MTADPAYDAELMHELAESLIVLLSSGVSRVDRKVGIDHAED